MKKFDLKKFTFFLIILNVIFFIGLTINPKPKVTENVSAEEREVYLNILTTDQLAYSMVKDIVKDKHFVQYMFKKPEEIIDYKYTDDAINNISNMDLFIYMGAGHEPWIDDFISKLKKGKVGIINASRGIRVINYDEVKITNSYEIKTNPYYWLSPDDLKVALYNIKCSIQDKDPKNREYYEQNYNIALENLDKALNEFNDKTRDVKKSSIEVVDSNLDYLMRYLGTTYTKVKPEELDKKIIEFEENNSNSKDTTIKKDNTSKIIFFDNEDNFNKYNEKLISLNYQCILVNKPYSLDSYNAFIAELEKNILAAINVNKGLVQASLDNNK